MLFKGFVGDIISEEDQEIEARYLRTTSKEIAQSHKFLDKNTKEKAYRTCYWYMVGGLVVNVLWGQDRIPCCIVNIYAPCVFSEKIELWDRLVSVINQNPSACICVIDDFNSIRIEAERDGRAMLPNPRDISAFNSFINDVRLIDLPLHGRSFTWYRANGSCESRLDRILVNSLWLQRWVNSFLKGLRRSISDHCPILLEINAKD
ncbi:hypothetical protein ACS0TY_022415 [Phlomoides rotata]